MTVPDGYQPEDARICMTLSGMAYASSKKDLRKLLKDVNYTTQGLWDLCWYGAQDENLLFMVRQKKTGQLAIVIRGTVWTDLKNVFEDLDVLHTVSWMNGYVSQGIYRGLQHLLQLEGEDGSTLLNYILQYLADVNPPQIFITGHSLGGALASVFALHLKTSIVYPANWSVYTFASPTVGDPGFVRYYNNEFSDGISSAYRIYNNCMVAPTRWQLAGLSAWSPDLPGTVGGPSLTCNTGRFRAAANGCFSRVAIAVNKLNLRIKYHRVCRITVLIFKKCTTSPPCWKTITHSLPMEPCRKWRMHSVPAGSANRL